MERVVHFEIHMDYYTSVFSNLKLVMLVVILKVKQMISVQRLITAS